MAFVDLEGEPGAEVRMLIPHPPRRTARRVRSDRLGAFPTKVTHLEAVNRSALRARADMRRAGILPVAQTVREAKKVETPYFVRFMDLARRIDEHAFLPPQKPAEGELVSLFVSLPAQNGNPAERLRIGISKDPETMNERRHMFDQPTDIGATDSIFIERLSASSHETARVHLYDLTREPGDIKKEAEQTLAEIEGQLDRFEAAYLPPTHYPRLTKFSPVIDPGNFQ